MSLSALWGKQLPVPLGDDFDGAAGHFYGGLIVNRVRRHWYWRPLFLRWPRNSPGIERNVKSRLLLRKPGLSQRSQQESGERVSFLRLDLSLEIFVLPPQYSCTPVLLYSCTPA
jgi:hypothetical protein